MTGFGKIDIETLRSRTTVRREKRSRMDAERAEEIALTAAAWISKDDDLRDRLVALTGADLGGLGAALAGRDPEALSAVLDFLLGNEADLMAFVEAEGIDPKDPSEAAAILS